MKNFREYCEVSEFVDAVGDFIISERSFGDEVEDRVLGGAGEFGKSIAKGIGSAVASPFVGLWRAGRRMVAGSDRTEKWDAHNQFTSSKEQLVRALMFMDQPVREQEIEKLKMLLNSIAKEPKDNWAMMSGFDKRLGGLSGGIDYRKLTR